MGEERQLNSLVHILERVQKDKSCHEKYSKMLEKLYTEQDQGVFLKNFTHKLMQLFYKDEKMSCPFTGRVVEFCASFSAMISCKEELGGESFLSSIIQEILKNHNTVFEQVRYYKCKFVMQLLDQLGIQMQLDNNLCDVIQEAMLERIDDPRYTIRLQAVLALVRLQEPHFPECPVVQAYLMRMYDSNHTIRKAVVEVIAPTAITIQKIEERTRDVDAEVRVAAYTRCADIGPKSFRIADRHAILLSGFHDEHKAASQVFKMYLIAKWCTAYSVNFIEFLSALKLDADQEDIKNTAWICMQVVQVLFVKYPVTTIIENLPVDATTKLVPIQNLTSEIALYWWLVTKHLSTSDNTEDFLSGVIPELTHFCKYIQNFVELSSTRKMEEWEYWDYQYTLCSLFNMISHCDLHDEVGRQALRKLILWMLQCHKFSYKVVSQIVEILSLLSNDLNAFTTELCEVLDDIEQSLTEDTQNKTQVESNADDLEFKKAKLKVKIEILSESKQEELAKENYAIVAEIQQELIKLEEELSSLNKSQDNARVQTTSSKDSKENICQCLDILRSILVLPQLKSVTPALRTCLNNFVYKLLQKDLQNSEIHWRLVKCVGLYCLIDKDLAQLHGKYLALPIASYRIVPSYNKEVVVSSLASVCDLIRLYGPKLFGLYEDTTNQQQKRKLYHNEDADAAGQIDNQMTLDNLFDIILDMLDDENDVVRKNAGEVIFRLACFGYSGNPNMFSRIILKWYNPSTESKLTQKLGALIKALMSNVQDAQEKVQKAVCPIITILANAPKTSPLTDVNLDNVLRFLAQLTENVTGIVHLHNILATCIVQQISSKPEESNVPYLAKMLMHLRIVSEDRVFLKDLIDLVMIAETSIVDKAPKNYLNKFVAILQGLVELCKEQAPVQQIVPPEEPTAPEETVRPLRGRKRQRKKPITVLDEVSNNSLLTISEQQAQVSALNDQLCNITIAESETDEPQSESTPEPESNDATIHHAKEPSVLRRSKRRKKRRVK